MSEGNKQDRTKIFIATVLFFICLFFIIGLIKFSPPKNVPIIDSPVLSGYTNKVQIYCGNETSGSLSWAIDVKKEEFDFINDSLINNPNRKECKITFDGRFED